MLIGGYHHNIDEKSRIVLPAKYREELGNNFIITRGLDGCLFIYPNEEWQKIIEKLKDLPFTKKDARAFLRFFLSGAIESTFDKQGRVFIPGQLVNYASINKECVIIGVNERLEIWSKEKYDEFFSSNEQNITDIAEDLFSLGGINEAY